MHSPTCAGAAWSDFRRALCLGQPRARLRLLATVTSLVTYAGRELEPETRADVCERIVGLLEARIRTRDIRSPTELLHAADGELVRSLPGVARGGLSPSTDLLARLGDSLGALPEAQRRVLSDYYGPEAGVAPERSDLPRRLALAELRGRLSLDAR